MVERKKAAEKLELKWGGAKSGCKREAEQRSGDVCLGQILWCARDRSFPALSAFLHLGDKAIASARSED